MGELFLEAIIGREVVGHDTRLWLDILSKDRFQILASYPLNVEGPDAPLALDESKHGSLVAIKPRASAITASLPPEGR